METKELTFDEVEARLSQIKASLTEENADIDALASEVDALEVRKAELKAEAEKRSKIEAIVNENKDCEVIETVEIEEERKTMNEIEVRNSREYVDAFANYIKTGKADECRALLTENVSGTVAVPELVENIVRTAWDKEGIMSLVKKSYLKGNLKVGFEISADGAVIHTEGADAPTEETLTLGIVELVPASIKKWITISDEAMDLRGESFLQYVYNEVAYQIAKKSADTLIAKIEACGTVSTTTAPAVPVVTEATVGIGTVAKAVAELSDEATNPVVIMNKSTWADFKAVQYANKFAVDPFEGLPVVFNNSMKSYTVATTGDTYAIVGDLGQGALANFPNGEEITFKFDDKSLAEKDLVKIVGRQYVGIGVVAPKSFVKIAK